MKTSAAIDPNITVAEYFIAVFKPAKIAGTCASNQKNWTIAIRLFCRWREGIKCSEVDAELLDAFQTWRVSEGFASTAKQYRSKVASVVRHYNPDITVRKALDRRAARHAPTRAAAAAKPIVEGSLRWLYHRGYRVKHLRGGSPKTDFQYEVQFRHFDRWLARECVTADLHEETIAAFLEHHARTRSARTVNKAYYCLRALWEYAARRRLVPDFPTLDAMYEPRRIPRCWTVDEMGRLMESIKAEPGRICGVPAPSWWNAFVLVAYTTGERLGALLAVRLTDVDVDAGEILIKAEDRKGGRTDALYRLRADAHEAVVSIREPERIELFQFDHSLATFYKHVTRILRRAGLPHDRTCKVQKLRRTFASHLEAAGGNATEALGHSTRAVTKRAYLDPRICGGQNPADLLPKIPTPKKDDAA